MKLFKVMLFVLFCATATANSGSLCFHHGDCVTDKTEDGILCLWVNDGFDVNGNDNCIKRCYRTKTTSYCSKVDNAMYGHCVTQRHDVKVKGNNCENPIPAEIIDAYIGGR
jgi:hypothetical protein